MPTVRSSLVKSSLSESSVDDSVTDRLRFLEASSVGRLLWTLSASWIGDTLYALSWRSMNVAIRGPCCAATGRCDAAGCALAACQSSMLDGM